MIVSEDPHAARCRSALEHLQQAGPMTQRALSLCLGCSNASTRAVVATLERYGRIRRVSRGRGVPVLLYWLGVK